MHTVDIFQHHISNLINVLRSTSKFPSKRTETGTCARGRKKERETNHALTIAQMYMHDGETFILLLESFARKHTDIHMKLSSTLWIFYVDVRKIYASLHAQSGNRNIFESFKFIRIHLKLRERYAIAHPIRSVSLFVFHIHFLFVAINFISFLCTHCVSLPSEYLEVSLTCTLFISSARQFTSFYGTALAQR